MNTPVARQYASDFAHIENEDERRAQYLAWKHEEGRPDHLSSRLSAKVRLSEEEISSLVGLLGHRCQSHTVNRIEGMLRYGFSTMDIYGIYERVEFENGEASYTAGQDYTAEIRYVRERILKG